MQPLRSADLLDVWDRGRGRHPIDRALIVLAFACRDRAWDELSRLPIGERNRLLLAVRALTFGPRLDMVAVCPACGVELEFDFSFRASDFAPVVAEPVEARLPGGTMLRLRLPDSRDLAEVANVSDAASARQLLVARCVLGSTEAERVNDANGSAALVTAFSEAVEQHDPLAVIAFPVTCVECGKGWRAILDPVDYTWRQIAQRVSAIVREVHTLARAYGWSETEVLRMSSARRRLYIEQAGA